MTSSSSSQQRRAQQLLASHRIASSDDGQWQLVLHPTNAKQEDEKAKQAGVSVENTKTGQSWILKTSDNKPGNFVVLPTQPNSDILTVLDNRTGKTYDLKIENNSINATIFAQMKLPGSEGLRVFDPGYQNTAVCRSQICYIDGEQGILRYRGYPIEELAEKSSFLEVAFLLIYGDLPTKTELDEWHKQIMRHTILHINLSHLMKSFNYDAHPMGMFISVMAAMSTFHPEANPSLTQADIYNKDERVRNIQIYRILGKAATVAACSYRHRIGREYNYPASHMSYTGNFLYMLDRLSENNYEPNPVLAKALDVLFILHADHELNCSTAAMRHISSSQVDPYSSIAGAAAALYGPLHGGACEAVLRMLEEIGSVENVPDFLEGVKKRERKLMGFGHRVYKNYDPRARIIKATAYEVFKVCGREALIDIAIKLEEAALSDEYFIKRRLYPNVDFYSGLIYKAMGFPTDFFPVLFAIPRVAGWLAHWNESLKDESKIWRPRQLYTGADKRSYVPAEYRSSNERPTLLTYSSEFGKRSRVATFSGSKL